MCVWRKPKGLLPLCVNPSIGHARCKTENAPQASSASLSKLWVVALDTQHAASITTSRCNGDPKLWKGPRGLQLVHVSLARYGRSVEQMATILTIAEDTTTAARAYNAAKCATKRNQGRRISGPNILIITPSRRRIPIESEHSSHINNGIVRQPFRGPRISGRTMMGTGHSHMYISP